MFRVVESAHEENPKANMPTVLFPAAELLRDGAVEAVPALTTQPEYVYLLRVVVPLKQASAPNANIPTVLLPAAEPTREATVAAPPVLTTQPE